MRESIKNVFLLAVLYTVVFVGKFYFRIVKAIDAVKGLFRGKQ